MVSSFWTRWEPQPNPQPVAGGRLPWYSLRLISYESLRSGGSPKSGGCARDHLCAFQRHLLFRLRRITLHRTRGAV